MPYAEIYLSKEKHQLEWASMGLPIEEVSINRQSEVDEDVNEREETIV